MQCSHITKMTWKCVLAEWIRTVITLFVWIICRHKLYHSTVTNIRVGEKLNFVTIKWYNLCMQKIQSQMCYLLISEYPSHLSHTLIKLTENFKIMIVITVEFSAPLQSNIPQTSLVFYDFNIFLFHVCFSISQWLPPVSKLFDEVSPSWWHTQPDREGTLPKGTKCKFYFTLPNTILFHWCNINPNHPFKICLN